MPAREILLLGNPILRKQCVPVTDASSPETKALIADLKDTLADFRARKGFGRGIAAPQIGSSRQIIYIDFEIQGPLINPRIMSRSRKKFRLWDDCFSFPDILVQVERNYSVVVAFRDENGKSRRVKAEGALSELLQHEIDHLQGILAIDRAIDSKHIVLRSEYERMVHRGPVAL
ncbi:MAG: peptide deformylase [Ignavibacteriales bacterium]|nr:peptide deformylase [Ignavibacteriales bacterium]